MTTALNVFPDHVSDPGSDFDNIEMIREECFWVETDTVYFQVIEHFLDLYGPGRMGGDKAVFLTGDGWVVKVPFNKDSEAALVKEELCYKAYRAGRGFPVAECYTEEFMGILIERMELVTRHNFEPWDLPGWVDQIDSRQVGFNRFGELVAFDI